MHPRTVPPGGLSRVEPDILVGDRLFGPGAIYRAVRDPVGGVGEKMRFRGASGVLVAQLARRHCALGLRDFPTRPRHHYRARNGAFHLHPKPDVGGQGKGQTSSVWGVNC